MDYSTDLVHAVRFTGGEEYLDQLEIWEIMLKVLPGKNYGTLTLGISELTN